MILSNRIEKALVVSFISDLARGLWACWIFSSSACGLHVHAWMEKLVCACMCARVCMRVLVCGVCVRALSPALLSSPLWRHAWIHLRSTWPGLPVRRPFGPHSSESYPRYLTRLVYVCMYVVCCICCMLYVVCMYVCICNIMLYMFMYVWMHVCMCVCIYYLHLRSSCHWEQLTYWRLWYAPPESQFLISIYRTKT